MAPLQGCGCMEPTQDLQRDSSLRVAFELHKELTHCYSSAGEVHPRQWSS